MVAIPRTRGFRVFLTDEDSNKDLRPLATAIDLGPRTWLLEKISHRKGG